VMIKTSNTQNLSIEIVILVISLLVPIRPYCRGGVYASYYEKEQAIEVMTSPNSEIRFSYGTPVYSEHSGVHTRSTEYP
jgi:hypothetical protein